MSQILHLSDFEILKFCISQKFNFILARSKLNLPAVNCSSREVNFNAAQTLRVVPGNSYARAAVLGWESEKSREGGICQNGCPRGPRTRRA